MPPVSSNLPWDDFGSPDASISGMVRAAAPIWKIAFERRAASLLRLGMGGLACVLLTMRGYGQTTTNPDNSLLLVPPDTSIPSITSMGNPYTELEISPPPLGSMASIAATSGISNPSGTSATVLNNQETISRTVSVNPFQPPDLITSGEIVPLAPLHDKDTWDLTFNANESLDYDSNITRSSSVHTSDGYLHSSAGFDFRLGTTASPFALNAAYDYSADLFDQQKQFDTYTHDFSLSTRLGRSTFILVPYAVGRFRSVENQSAAASDRQSYNFLVAGVHGEGSYFPNLVHDFDFSHTSVSYPARDNSDFEMWDLSQQLNYRVETPSKQRLVQSIEIFPWVQLRQTSRDSLAAVDEVNCGVGGAITLANRFAFRAQLGYGNVSSDDHGIDFGSYSGFRYDIGVSYQPVDHLLLAADCRRVVTFNPTVAARVTDQVDATLSAPFNLGSFFSLTPAFGVFRAVSDDYTFAEASIYLQPAVTFVYKIDDHAGAFAKVQYSTDIDKLEDTTRYTPDLQLSLGVNVLF